MNARSITHVAIVGAGPYGLSLAAHLGATDVPFRIFGRPMQSWATQMPAGMKLKSDGFASNLSSGTAPFTLEEFCRLTGRAYHATDLPVAVEDFTAYGQEFQRRLVPTLEQQNVTAIETDDAGFQLTTEDGETLLARHVVIATGVSLFQFLPDVIAHLPSALVTHSTDHRSFESFAGCDVTVLGRGASSLNAAALLHESGGRPTVLSRHQRIHVHEFASPDRQSLYERLRHPSSPLGSSLRSWLACAAPSAFRALPYRLRRLLVYKHLGPAGGTSLQGRIEGKMPMLTGWHIDSASLVPREIGCGPRIRLILRDASGATREHTTSHIIAGTGFRYNLERMSFLPQSLLQRIRRQPTGAPTLSSQFESTAKNLYFIGPVASTSFGPLLRFAAGAGYAAHRLTTHLARDFARQQTKTAPSRLKPAFDAPQHVAPTAQQVAAKL